LERTATVTDELLERWTHRAKRMGVRGNPEPPTLVAKVIAEPGHGELWVSGLPTKDSLHTFQELRLSLQIVAFKRYPTDVLLFDNDASTRGQRIPNTRYVRLEMSNPSCRSADLRACAPLVVHSLYGGDNAVVHCMTGLCRAPFAAALLSSIVHAEELPAAIERITSLRNTQLQKAIRSMGGHWTSTAVQMELSLSRYPSGFAAANQETALAHAILRDPYEADSIFPLCKWKKGIPQQQAYKKDPNVAETVREMAVFAARFCNDCKALLIASLQVEVDEHFSSATSH
jgi:hypothetical protein